MKQESQQLSQLLEHIQVIQYNNVHVTVTGITYDSRKVEHGFIYVARKGSNADGHDYIQKAIQNGASCIVCERLPEDVEQTIAVVQVRDAAKALAELSHALLDFPTKKLKVVGVTGTNGKTTCTYVLKQIAECLGKKVGMIGTTGNYSNGRFIETTFTTPEAPELCALFNEMIHDGVEYVFMEVSSHALAQHRVWGIEFAAAMFTNLTQDHLDFHNSMDEYAKAKKMLFDMLPQASIAILNSDDTYTTLMMRDTKANVLTVGRSNNPTVSILKELAGTVESRFELDLGDSTVEITTPLIGKFNIDNVAECVVMSWQLFNTKDKIADCVRQAQGAPGRMGRIALTNGAVGIVDYSHTPDALEKALTTCKELLQNSGQGKLICVFGCGGDRDKTKRPLMGRIAAELADVVIVTNDNPRTENPQSIIDDIIAGIDSDTHSIIIEPDRAKAIQIAVGQSSAGDILLVAGKGHENYQIIGTDKFHFDDFEQLQKYQR